MQDLLEISIGTQFKIQNESFNVREALEEVINIYAIQASFKHIKLECNAAPNVPEGLVSDRRRL